MLRPVVDEKKCVACGACEEVCPTEPNVFEVVEVAKVIHPEVCFVCRACVDACPTDAITIRSVK